jgi:hypothetical protein
MFRLIRPASHKRYIHGGRLYCPVRGRDIDVDLCAGCEWLTAINLGDELPFVRCRPEPIPAPLLRM